MSFPGAEVTRSLSNNLVKAGWVVLENDVRVIDTNELMEQRLKTAADQLSGRSDPEGEDEDGFTGGLAAEKVDALFDPDSEGAVLKSAADEELRAARQELEEARKELEQVKRETDDMVEKANARIEEMSAQALEEANARGYQEGYEKGMAQTQAAKEQYLSMQTQLEEEYSRRIEALEPEFIETITGIYEHIFRVDLSAYHELVTGLLTDAMQNTDTARNYIVHVSRQDYPAVCGAKEKILEETGTLSSNLEIISDMTLSPASCMIETENGIYDCSLGTELEELKRKLKLLSYHRPDVLTEIS